MTDLLARLAASVHRSNGLESLTRPLLDLLRGVTGLESAYLTSVDEAAGVQRVRYASNAGALQVPEGVEVPWQDALCRRALDEGTAQVDDVPARWPEATAARELGITAYVTAPVTDGEGRLIGTLCAASREPRDIPAETHDVLALFSRLIAQQIERESLLEALRSANAALRKDAATDTLTALPNRRALRSLLRSRLQEAEAHGCRLAVGFVDLDGFKAINDGHGHAAGDRFLHAIGERLSAVMRPGDVVGRYGGDEFLVVFEASERDAARLETLRERLEGASRGRFDLGEVTIDYPGASVGLALSAAGETDVDALVARADAAMYARKQARRNLG